jgi:ribosome biogenesis GTPase / thiamine phosphate phosphatase
LPEEGNASVIERYGWGEALQRSFEIHANAGLTPARVVVQNRDLYRLATRDCELAGTLSGRFAHEVADGEYPVTGDWVAIAARPREGSATIHHLLPRTSVFVRRASGPGGGQQTIAANVDVALLVSSLNADLNPRRIERYLATTYASGADPVIVLTKSDRCDDVAGSVAAIEAVAFGVPVLAVSALTGEGMDALKTRLTPGRTAALLGSSGVGKSTLVNALAGREAMATREIREEDARGRHTTTHRELILLPSGALVLDTPGMRELGLWDSDDGVSATFADIAALARQCRFNDCAHVREPGCAVREAIGNGELAADRFESFLKLNRELAWLERKENPQARIEARKVWIKRTRNYRARMKHRYEDE